MARRAQSSTSVPGGTVSRGGTQVLSYSGQGRTVTNLLLLLLCMGVMVGSFWAFASYPDSILIWMVGLVLYAVALLIPVGILSTSTAKKAEGGRTVLMDVPPTTEVHGFGTTAAQFGDEPRDIRERDALTAATHKNDKYGKATQ